MAIITTMTTPAAFLRAALPATGIAFLDDRSGAKSVLGSRHGIVTSERPAYGLFAGSEASYGKRRPHLSRFSPLPRVALG